MAAALVGTGCRDARGQLDNLGQPSRVIRIGDPDPERRPGWLGAESSDVAGRIDQRARDGQNCQFGKGALRSPAFDVAGRVEPAWHRPRIEPAAGQLTRSHAIGEYGRHLWRRVGCADLAAAQATHRAVRMPGAEHLVSSLEYSWSSREIQRPGSAQGIDVDGDHRAHDVHELADYGCCHYMPTECSADWSD